MSRDPQEASALWAELERIFELSKLLLLKLKRDFTKLKAEHTKVLEGFALRHKAKFSDQTTTLRQVVSAPNEACFQERDEVRR